MNRERGLVVLAGAVTLSMIAAFVMSVLAPEIGVEKAASDARSRSAVGHALLVDWLRRQGHDVRVVRARTADALRGDDLLLVIEPRLDLADDPEEAAARLADMVETADVALVVLPKRAAQPVAEEPWKVAWVRDLDADVPGRVLEALGVGGRVERQDAAADQGLGGVLDEPFEIARLQLVVDAGLEAEVETFDGVLLGRSHEDPDLWILADPDPLQTHGLVTPPNARLLADLIAALHPGGAIVIDESLHGDEDPESVWHQLLTPPLLFLTLQGLLILGAALWAGGTRFRPLPVAAPEPRRGDEVLVDLSARLAENAGKLRHALDRLLRHAIVDLIAALRLAPDADEQGRLAALAEAAERRGCEDPRVLAAEIRRTRTDDSGAVLAVARRIQDWRKEMIDGSRRAP